MPGTLHVSVLEAVELPVENAECSINFLFVKVSLGEQEFVTCYKRPQNRKTAPWRCDFEFQVLSLQNKLLVAVCDADGDVVSSTAIEVPTIVQEWFREEYAPLDEGGRIHLKLNFVVTKEEQQRLEFLKRAGDRKEFRDRRDDMLREYDFKRKENLCMNNGLRTIAENARVHAGQPLDNWEVFSKKKGKEEDRRLLDHSRLKDSSMTCVQDLSHGDTDSHSVQVVPAAKEAPRNTKNGAHPRAHHLMKDIPLQQPRIRENTTVPKASGDVQVPRLRDRKPRSLASPPNNGNMADPGVQQQAYNAGSSTTYQAQGISRLSNACVTVETKSSLKSEEFSTEEGLGSCKILTPPAPTYMDGWVCVERPPIMTWEDALKVAQKARENMAGPSTTTSPSTSLQTSNAAPGTSRTEGNISTSNQILSGQAEAFSPLPLPLPPKQTPSRISGRGCVKPCTNAVETSVHQGPDPSMTKLADEKNLAENPPGPSAVATKGVTIVGERVKTSDERGSSNEFSLQNSANGEEIRDANQDPDNGSSRENSSTDHQKSRDPHGFQSSGFDKPTAAGSLDLNVAGKLSRLGESRDTRTAWRLPEFQDIDVQALESQQTQNSLTEDEFVSGLEDDGKLSSMREEKCGHILEHVNCHLISHIQESSEAMEELEGKRREEKAVAAESLLPEGKKRVQITEDIASPDSEVTPDTHTESHHFNKVRRPRNPMISPKPAPSDSQKSVRSGDSLWKNLQDSSNESKKSIFTSGGSHEEFEQTSAETSAYGKWVTSKSLEDAFAAAARQVDFVFKEKSRTILENQQSPTVCPAPCEEKFEGSEGELPSTSNSTLPSHLGSGLKQVLGGVVILAGLFALWPRNDESAVRYHVVKAGETLNSIAPGLCTDPSSNFCRINPQVCDQKTIYPGQRIRLS